MERTVIIEFDSVEDAIAAHESSAYQEALSPSLDGADESLRTIEVSS